MKDWLKLKVAMSTYGRQIPQTLRYFFPEAQEKKAIWFFQERSLTAERTEGSYDILIAEPTKYVLF